MSGFTDKIQQADGITITLNCGLCGQAAGVGHACAKRYLRVPRIALVYCLADPPSSDPSDLFLVKLEIGGEEYITTRRIIERDFQEI